MLRKARLTDVPAINALINYFAERGRMLFRSQANLCDHIRDFVVWEENGKVVGCCALAVMWNDLAEIKSLAVDKDMHGKGIGRQMIEFLIKDAADLGLKTIFCLTLEPEFFTKLNFEIIEKKQLPMKVWSECVHCNKQDHCDEIAMWLPLRRAGETR
jgi:amino-acid N-acetyltransferase